MMTNDGACANMVMHPSNHITKTYRVTVRPGITGWAQVNGLRGDTSIRARVDYDLYYIENWSMLFDIKILLMTPFKGVVNHQESLK